MEVCPAIAGLSRLEGGVACPVYEKKAVAAMSDRDWKAFLDRKCGSAFPAEIREADLVVRENIRVKVRFGFILQGPAPKMGMLPIQNSTLATPLCHPFFLQAKNISPELLLQTRAQCRGSVSILFLGDDWAERKAAGFASINQFDIIRFAGLISPSLP